MRKIVTIELTAADLALLVADERCALKQLGLNDVEIHLVPFKSSDLSDLESIRDAVEDEIAAANCDVEENEEDESDQGESDDNE